MLPNEEFENLNNQYKLLHSNVNVWQESWTEYHAPKIQSLLNEFSCKTILDFGSGKGNQYHIDKVHMKFFNGIMPCLYDPGVIEYELLLNDKFDCVICTDVLEHIPEHLLNIIIEQIYSRSERCVYLGINNSPSQSKLPNGKDVHLTRKTGPWWIQKLIPFASKHTKLHTYGMLGYCDAVFDSHGLKDFPIIKNNDCLKMINKGDIK